MDESLARIRAGETLSEAEMTQLATEAPEELVKALTAARAPEPDIVTPAPDNTDLTEAERRFEERIKLSECRLMLAEALSESKLPSDVKDAIREDFTGTVFDESDLTKRIERDRKIAAKLVESAGGGQPNSGKVEITEDVRDKQQKALDGMFEGAPVDGVTPYQSLKQAYKDITGSTQEYISPNLVRGIIAEAHQFTPTDWDLRESITSGTWGEMLGDSITRRMIREYNHPDFTSWRRLVTDVVPLNDFRTQRRMRMGGYGNLPGVSESAPYQNLDSPGDEEATYSPSKRGGLEDLTMETIANDDVGAVRRIPVKLGRAASRTIYHYVWNTIIRDNATATYDSTTLFHANHGNTDTDAFSTTALLAVENTMRDQTAYGETAHVLGASNMPRILAIPNELRESVFRATQSGVMSQASSFNATEPNMFQDRYEVIVVDDWTDADNWYAFADPQNTPLLEAGFLNGREEPELFVQDQPTVGSTFTADKLTYKIRHIWGFGILDHRGAYRQVVA